MAGDAVAARSRHLQPAAIAFHPAVFLARKWISLAGAAVNCRKAERSRRHRCKLHRAHNSGGGWVDRPTGGPTRRHRVPGTPRRVSSCGRSRAIQRGPVMRSCLRGIAASNGDTYPTLAPRAWAAATLRNSHYRIGKLREICRRANNLDCCTAKLGNQRKFPRTGKTKLGVSGGCAWFDQQARSAAEIVIKSEC